MVRPNNRSGFTLVEILVVIIIIGVLASVAMPQLFLNVERSRAAEALNSLGVIKRQMEGCAVQFNDVYTTCATFDQIGMFNPGISAGAHFNYAIAVTAPTVYAITATRITLDNGTAGDTIVLSRTAANSITRSGTGAFVNIQ